MKTFKKIVDILIKMGEARAKHLQLNPSLMKWY
jgi:hypothetical protein